MRAMVSLGPPSPHIVFLSNEQRDCSRGRLENEGRAMGLRVPWLLPQYFDLLVIRLHPPSITRRVAWGRAQLLGWDSLAVWQAPGC